MPKKTNLYENTLPDEEVYPTDDTPLSEAQPLDTPLLNGLDRPSGGPTPKLILAQPPASGAPRKRFTKTRLSQIDEEGNTITIEEEVEIFDGKKFDLNSFLCVYCFKFVVKKDNSFLSN